MAHVQLAGLFESGFKFSTEQLSHAFCWFYCPLQQNGSLQMLLPLINVFNK